MLGKIWLSISSCLLFQSIPLLLMVGTHKAKDLCLDITTRTKLGLLPQSFRVMEILFHHSPSQWLCGQLNLHSWGQLPALSIAFYNLLDKRNDAELKYSTSSKSVLLASLSFFFSFFIIFRDRLSCFS